MDIIIVGTDTDVGKSHVTSLIVRGLRAAQRRVWVHKPVACGDWRDQQADDGRIMAALADATQDPALVCPLQFPEAASPHLAAAAAGVETSWREMAASITSLQHAEHDLIIEAAGGILAPLATDGGTICDIAAALKLPVVLVTRPHLGTLNHSQLTVRELRRQGITLLGLCINDHDSDIDYRSLAIHSAAAELARLCETPVLAHIPYNHSVHVQSPSQSLSQCTDSEHAHHESALAQRLISLHAAT